MKKTYILPFLLIPFVVACNNSEPQDKPEIRLNYADIFLCMGQSNMAGRGEAADSIPCLPGHGYEFYSVTGSEGNYFGELTEPFGKYENNDAMTDGNTGDGKKTGDLVASFAEGYYKETNVPIIGVSASVGNTSISKWTPGTAYFNECVRRLKSCIDEIRKEKIFVVRNINMIWCQGSNDATAYVENGFDYFGKLQAIYDGLHELGEGYAVENCILLTLSPYGNPNKQVLCDDQIAYCTNHENFICGSKKFSNVPENMRDDPHFHQGIYNVVGYDAGVRIGKYFETGELLPLTEFVIGEDVTLAESYNVNLTYKSTDA